MEATEIQIGITSRNRLWGQRFGRLTVLEATGECDSTGVNLWLCQCDCGEVTKVTGRKLRKGITKSCGCLGHERGLAWGASSFIDLSGKKFGRLTVVERAGSDIRGAALFLCRCDCGKTKKIMASRLKSGVTKSCGCFRRENSSKQAVSKFIDLTGQRFGRLTAIEKIGRSKGGNAIFLCQCDCGEFREVTSPSLRQKDVRRRAKSCGKCGLREEKKRLKNHEKYKLFTKKSSIPAIAHLFCL